MSTRSLLSAIKDGTAVTRFLFWLEKNAGKKGITEITAAEKLLELRKSRLHFIDNSFDAIMAFNAHSAMSHYKAEKGKEARIEKKGVFLTDSGGNYLGGTTDITRTLSFGPSPGQVVKDYTLVLKGHIAVASAVFPEGTKGFQIDSMARRDLWRAKRDFGHGVGFFLCVHEGPASISPRPVNVPLKKGMVLSNEPGVYREGRYGIRIENLVMVTSAGKSGFGKFLKFETLTLCHYETGLIDKGLLTRFEIEWINAYHEKVRRILSPGLTKPERAWLRRKTRKL